MKDYTSPILFSPINQILDDIEKLPKDKIMDLAIKINSNPVLSTIFTSITGPVGGAISKYLSGKALEKRFERAHLFAQSIKESLTEEVNKKIDAQFLESDEFYYIFERVFERVIKTRCNEKIKRFRNIFINSCTQELSKSPIKDIVIDIAENCTEHHIIILNFIFINAIHQLAANRTKPYKIRDELIMEFQNYEKWEINILLNDLERIGLIHSIGPDPRQPSSSGVRYGVTGFASIFRKFISDPT